MKKVLVSGAGGFVGARIMAQLAGRYELCAFPKGMLAAADETAVAELVWHEQGAGSLDTLYHALHRSGIRTYHSHDLA